MVKKLLLAVGFFCAMCGGVSADEILFRFGKSEFPVPFRVVHGTELYSFVEGKGLTGLQTILWQRGNAQFGVGAAPEFGTSNRVSFASFQTRLSEKFFDISDNGWFFGAYAGHRTGENVKNPKTVFNDYGANAGIKFW